MVKIIVDFPEETNGELLPVVVDKKSFQIFRKFQKFVGLPETGELDDKTRKKMKMPRCGDVDFVLSIRSGNTTILLNQSFSRLLQMGQIKSDIQ